MLLINKIYIYFNFKFYFTTSVSGAPPVVRRRESLDVPENRLWGWESPYRPHKTVIKYKYRTVEKIITTTNFYLTIWSRARSEHRRSQLCHLRVCLFQETSHFSIFSALWKRMPECLTDHDCLHPAELRVKCILYDLQRSASWSVVVR